MEVVTQNPMNGCALLMRLATYWNLITVVGVEIGGQMIAVNEVGAPD